MVFLFATAHGKGQCDGLAGTIKKMVLEPRFVRAVTVHGALMVHATKPIEN